MKLVEKQHKTEYNKLTFKKGRFFAIIKVYYGFIKFNKFMHNLLYYSFYFFYHANKQMAQFGYL